MMKELDHKIIMNIYQINGVLTVSWATVSLRTTLTSIVVGIIVKRKANHTVINCIQRLLISIFNEHLPGFCPKVSLSRRKRANGIFVESAGVAISLDRREISENVLLRFYVPVRIEEVDLVKATTVEDCSMASIEGTALDTIDVFFWNSGAEHDVFVLFRAG